MNSQNAINFVVDRPKQSLFLCFIVLILAAPGLMMIHLDFSYRIWFQEDSLSLKQFDNFEKKFGNDEILLAAVYKESGIFNPKTLSILSELTEAMWHVEGVIDVDSLTNFHYAYSDSDEIIIEPLFQQIENEISLAQDVKRAYESKIAPNFLFNQSGTIALVFAKQRPYFKVHPNEELIVQEGREVIGKFQKKFPNHKFLLSGGVTVADAYREVAEGDLKKLLGIMFLFIALLLGIFFKNIKGVIFPFILIGATVIITMGISGLVGVSFNNIVALIPQTLMAIAIADAVHIIVNYVQYKRVGLNNKNAARKTLEKNFWPTFFTSLSTIFGFLSFITAVITPLIHFGLLAALGTLLAWFLSIFGLGALLALGGKKKHYKDIDKRANDSSFRSAFVAYGVRVIFKHQSWLVFFAIVLMLGSTFLGMQNEVNSSPVKFFKDDVIAKKSNDFLLDKFGGFSGPQIIIDSGIENGSINPDFLKKVEVFERWLLKKSEIIKVTSIIDIIKLMNKAINEGRENEFKIPENRKQISELLLLYQMSLSSGKSLNEKVTIDKRYVRLAIFWNIQNSKEAGVEFESFNKKAKELGLKIVITGKSALFQSLNERVVSSFLSSMSLALLLVSCLIVFIFGSVKVGIVSLIPNLLPLAMGAAVMTLLEIPLSIGTCLVFSVCLGIVVDDSIHFLLSYRRQILKGVSKELAIQDVMYTTGTSLFITTVILFFAFGLFVFAQFVPNMHFGIISSVIFLTALFADLIILPALLLKIDLKS